MVHNVQVITTTRQPVFSGHSTMPSTSSLHSHGMNSFSTTRAAQQTIIATR